MSGSEVADPVRVAHVMGKMMAGGVESVVLNYFRHVDTDLLRFDLIVDSDSTEVPIQEVEALGGRVFFVPPYQHLIRYLPALVRLFREADWPIVHSHLNTLSVFPLLAAWIARVPIRIAHSHSTAASGEGIKNLVKYLLRPFSMLLPSHLFACSPYAGEWLFGKRAVEAGRVRVLPNAIEIDKYRFSERTREELRRDLGITDSLVIGHVGRFTYQKNHSFLIDVFAEIRQQESRAVLLLVGDGELRASIEAKVARLDLAHSVMFLGVRDDLPNLYQAMDIFCLPSLYEGFGIVVLEAQVAGLPCVCSDVVPRETRPSVNTEYVSNWDVSTWTTRVLQSSGPDRSSAVLGVEFANYDIEASAAALQEFYLEISEAAIA
ncbi:MAG: glycosyltransferase family 1 protein [Coriobacteriia bacterium]|nr:glycosyltransferase family 1 protein [Coriobacteriia bacterium]